jgi:hypothetical protein
MVRVAMSDLKEGQVLVEPVQVQGRFLLAAGVAITRNHLRIFKTWGVVEVAIEGDAPDAGGPDLDSAEVRFIRAEIDRRFEKCDGDNEVIAALKKTVLKRAIDRCLGTAATVKD